MIRCSHVGGILAFGLQPGCVHFLEPEQRQVMDQLNREVMALQIKNERLSEQVENCDQDSGPNEVYPELRQLLGSSELEIVAQGPRTLVMIPGGLLFSPNSTRLRQEASMELDLLAAVLSKHQSHEVQITAHMNTVNMSSSMRRRHVSLWEFAAAQATAVMRRLVQDHGLAAERFTIASRGDVEPLEDPGASDRRFPDWRILIQIVPLKRRE